MLFALLAFLPIAIAFALPQYGAPAPPVYAPPLVSQVKTYSNSDLSEISPYTFNYAVADDYSKTNFNVAESDDGTGVREGSYNVALPDGRIQHVKYTTNDYDGFVAEITYDGQAQYPPGEAYRVPKPTYGAPPLAYAPAVPVYGAPVVKKALVPVVHQQVAVPVAHRSVLPAFHAVPPQ